MKGLDSRHFLLIMTEKEIATDTESKDVPETGKEEVICPVCSNFEPQAWRKTMCRNCFHPLDDHGGEDPGSESKSSKDKGKTNETDKKKSTPEKEPPKTLPKSGLALKNKGLSIDTKKDSKDKQPSTPTSKSPTKFTPGSKQSEAESLKGKLSSALTSPGSKKPTTNEKNAPKDGKTDTKTGNLTDNKKQTGAGPSALSKWKNNETNVTSSKDKAPPDSKAKELERDKNKAGDDKSNKNKFGDDKQKSKDTVNKLKSEELSKVKQFSRSFSDGHDLEDKKFNSLDRLKKGGLKEKSDKSAASGSADNKPGIKQSTNTDAAHKKTFGATPGIDNDKESTSATSSKGSSALSEKVNKFSSCIQEQNKNGTLERRKVSGKQSMERELQSMGPLASAEGQRIDGELDGLKKKLDDMELKCNSLEKENINLKKGLEVKEQLEGNLQKQKLDVENAIKGLQGQLHSMVSRCSKLETDNNDLIDNLKKQQEHQKEAMANATSKEEYQQMEADLNQSEVDIENLQDENEKLKTEIQDLKVEMDEMYDSFREQEAEEFRDLQRELEMTAKNCRVLQFKLRKAERRNEQVETDRQQYEEKLRILQNQFEDADAVAHIATVEDELRMAKEVSVRLHDELDIMEDKRQKVEEENSHLTRLLEHSDKKQFRLEMEVDKLRDQVGIM